MSFFSYHNHQIYFERRGKGNPLILLHGNTASSRMFDQIVPMLEADNTVLTMDFLGCGQSDRLSSWPCDLWFEWSRQDMSGNRSGSGAYLSARRPSCNDKQYE